MLLTPMSHVILSVIWYEWVQAVNFFSLTFLPNPNDVLIEVHWEIQHFPPYFSDCFNTFPSSQSPKFCFHPCCIHYFKFSNFICQLILGSSFKAAVDINLIACILTILANITLDDGISRSYFTMFLLAPCTGYVQQMYFRIFFFENCC